MDTKQHETILSQITKHAITAIQKAGHSQKKKPYSEVNIGMTYSSAESLLEGYGEILSKNKGMIRKSFTPQQIFEFLPQLPKIIHPVTFEGSVWCLPGHKVSIYCFVPMFFDVN